MEREHYRRYTSSRLKNNTYMPREKQVYSTQSEKPEPSSFTEKLIVQGIISGIILTVILLLNLVDHPRATSILTSLNKAISQNVSVEQVATEVRRVLGEELADLPNTVPIPAATAPPESNPEAEPPTATRIDDEILQEILGQRESDNLQTTAPEPIAPPEL